MSITQVKNSSWCQPSRAEGSPLTHMCQIFQVINLHGMQDGGVLEEFPAESKGKQSLNNTLNWGQKL